jgi:hypothetical protein
MLDGLRVVDTDCCVYAAGLIRRAMPCSRALPPSVQVTGKEGGGGQAKTCCKRGASKNGRRGKMSFLDAPPDIILLGNLFWVRSVPD